MTILTIYGCLLWAIALKGVLDKIVDQEEIGMRYKVESSDWFMVAFAPLAVPMKFAIKLDRKSRERREMGKTAGKDEE